MCRALRVLCGAADAGALAALKRAAVSAHWELVGGATSGAELVRQAAEWRPDVVVVEAGLVVDVAGLRAAAPGARIVAVGEAEGLDVDAVAADPGDLRAAILGLPGPGGPVRA
jgi:hypothetical protein